MTSLTSFLSIQVNPAPPVFATPLRRRLRKSALIALLALTLGACDLLPKAKPAPTEPMPSAPAQAATPSPAPLAQPKTEDILFAQTALASLGYRPGQPDGIWGPRSAHAIRNFETQQGIRSANGRLSELNLSMLENLSGVTRSSVAQSPPPTGIGAKLDPGQSLSDAPQLIIIDKPYTMLAKPNPFSEQLATLAIGTGVYVIRLQEGWYEIESEDRQRGFIQAD